MSHKNGVTKKCGYCKKETYIRRPKIKEINYCSKECFDLSRVVKVIQKCQNCNVVIKRVPSHANRSEKYIACSRECLGVLWKGINHSGFFKTGNKAERCINYKTGTQVTNGYISVLSPNHPCANKRGYVYQHRLVMEASIGRYLTPEEVVHHINFDKKDNRIENLMLFPNDREHRKHHTKLKHDKSHLCPDNP